MNRILLTQQGLQNAEVELKRLKSIDRPAIIHAIAQAREHGDLSENAEYHAAREKQSYIEGRIKELEGIIGRAQVIDVTTLSGPVKFGATIALIDEDTEVKYSYQIVSEYEADITRNLLNINSPLARALIGKDKGDSVEVSTPGGEKAYTIINIKFI